MKYLCFGYLNVENWSRKTPDQQNAMVDECFGYDEVLRKNGHWAGGEGIQPPDQCANIRTEGDKVIVTDGPYAETKELLGGLLILEARDLNQAIQLISKHPGVKMGRWEIRPVADITPMIKESEKRRAHKQ